MEILSVSLVDCVSIMYKIHRKSDVTGRRGFLRNTDSLIPDSVDSRGKCIRKCHMFPKGKNLIS